jgi:hypothetical protein
MRVYCIFTNEKEQGKNNGLTTYFLAPGRFLLRFYEEHKQLRLDTGPEALEAVSSSVLTSTEDLERRTEGGSVISLAVDENIARPFLDLVDETSKSGNRTSPSTKSPAIIGSFFEYLLKLKSEYN